MGFKTSTKIRLALLSVHLVIIMSSLGHTSGKSGWLVGLSAYRIFLRARYKMLAAISLLDSFLKLTLPLEIIKSEILSASVVIR